MITFGLDLNLIPGKVLPRLNVSQYDKGQTVSVSLWNGDVPYSIPAECTAQVVGTKADKTGFMYECTIENGQPSFVITDQMTVFPGEVTLEVIIMDADNRIGTVNFILDVERAALADDTQISESDMPIIQQLPEIRAEVEAAAALAEAWAVGPGTEQEPSATNNAYYWAMQAASAAGGGLQPSVVQELPTQNISTSTIYFVPSSDPSTSNYYDEYINLDGTSQGWELIGTTAIDLTDYYTKGEVDALLATINSNVTNLDTQVKACSGQAKEYSTTKNYVPTDMVYHNGMLYQCIGAHTGAWDDLYFEPVDLSLLQTRYNNLNTHLTRLSWNELWSNPNPASNFTEQTITLSSSNYDFLLVESYINATYPNMGVVTSVIPSGIVSNITSVWPNPSGAECGRRGATPSGASLTITDATYFTPGGGATTQNNRLVPIKIYGMKNV